MTMWRVTLTDPSFEYPNGRPRSVTHEDGTPPEPAIESDLRAYIESKLGPFDDQPLQPSHPLGQTEIEWSPGEQKN